MGKARQQKAFSRKENCQKRMEWRFETDSAFQPFRVPAMCTGRRVQFKQIAARRLSMSGVAADRLPTAAPQLRSQPGVPPLVQAHRTPPSPLISDSALRVSLGRPLPTLSQRRGNQSKFNWRADRTVLTMGFSVLWPLHAQKERSFFGVRQTGRRDSRESGRPTAVGAPSAVGSRRPGSWSRWCRSCQMSKWPRKGTEWCNNSHKCGGFECSGALRVVKPRSSHEYPSSLKRGEDSRKSRTRLACCKEAGEDKGRVV